MARITVRNLNQGNSTGPSNNDKGRYNNDMDAATSTERTINRDDLRQNMQNMKQTMLDMRHEVMTHLTRQPAETQTKSALAHLKDVIKAQMLSMVSFQICGFAMQAGGLALRVLLTRKLVTWAISVSVIVTIIRLMKGFQERRGGHQSKDTDIFIRIADLVQSGRIADAVQMIQTLSPDELEHVIADLKKQGHESIFRKLLFENTLQSYDNHTRAAMITRMMQDMDSNSEHACKLAKNTISRSGRLKVLSTEFVKIIQCHIAKDVFDHVILRSIGKRKYVNWENVYKNLHNHYYLNINSGENHEQSRKDTAWALLCVTLYLTTHATTMTNPSSGDKSSPKQTSSHHAAKGHVSHTATSRKKTTSASFKKPASYIEGDQHATPGNNKKKKKKLQNMSKEKEKKTKQQLKTIKHVPKQTRLLKHNI